MTALITTEYSVYEVDVSEAGKLRGFHEAF